MIIGSIDLKTSCHNLKEGCYRNKINTEESTFNKKLIFLIEIEQEEQERKQEPYILIINQMAVNVQFNSQKGEQK